MKRVELVAQVAAKIGLNKRASAAVVEWFLRCIVEALQAGDKVELRGFGSFRCRPRPPRRGRNPRTTEAVEVPAKTVPHFKTGKVLHERLNPELAQAADLAEVAS
jgi:integration host factor subunit beta